MGSHFWDDTLPLIFFAYGLAFYSLGLALLVESGRASALSLVRTIRLLAAFGLLHGLHEWLDLLDFSLARFYDVSFPTLAAWIRLSMLVASFLALLAFGEGLLRYEPHRKIPSWWLTIGALGWYTLSAIAVRLIYNLNETEWLEIACNLARYVIGIPGALLACVALWRQRSIFRERGMGLFAKDLTLAAIAIALYGVVGQFITAESRIFPSNIIHEDVFFDVFHFPIQLFRAVAAAIVAVSMIRVLQALEIENRQRIESVEQRSREELALLNDELRAAKEEVEHLLEEVQRREMLRGALLQRTTAAQEAERQRIARELHDDTGQALTGLAMGLRGVTGRLHNLGQPEAADQLAQLESVAKAALNELRLLINDLRPPQLDDMGLVAALRWMLDRMGNHYALDVALSVQGEPIPLSPEVEITLFRIAQEGMTNIGKHAGACQARLDIHFNSSLTMKIQDDGCGFDPDLVFSPDTPRNAWGLLGIQERANLINAQLSVESLPGHGTTLTIQLATEGASP